MCAAATSLRHENLQMQRHTVPFVSSYTWAYLVCFRCSEISHIGDMFEILLASEQLSTDTGGYTRVLIPALGNYVKEYQQIGGFNTAAMAQRTLIAHVGFLALFLCMRPCRSLVLLAYQC
jgi:hypothetical protein